MGERGVFNRAYTIFTYEISKLDKVSRVRFVYLLKGRNSAKGLIEELKGRFLTNGCFILPSENQRQMEILMKSWQVSYKIEEVLMH